jgi:transposase InsO family protein
MKEMAYLELDISKAFVRSPECNGCIERFNRTIKEEVFNIQRIYSLEQAQRIIEIFIGNYNREWMILRLKYMSPLEYRAEYERNKAA